MASKVCSCRRAILVVVNGATVCAHCDLVKLMPAVVKG